MTIPAFVINLKRRVDRYQSFNERFRGYDKILRMEFIEAIDGLQLRLEDVVKISRNFCNMKIGEAGCILSHRLCWSRIVDENLQYAIIFEDDARPYGYYGLVESLVSSDMPHNFEVIYLGVWTAYDQEKHLKMLASSERIAKYPWRRQAYTYAYVLSLEGAKKLLANFEAMCWLAADHYINRVLTEKYIHIPFLFHAPQGSSDIQGKGNDIRLQ